MRENRELIGIAAACCGHLLQGVNVRLPAGVRAPVPAIVISQATQSLMTGVFQQPDLFADLAVIDRRVVAWGRNAAPVSLPHAAVVISEDALATRLRQRLPAGTRDAEWTVYTSLPLPASVAEHNFGSRKASAVRVELKAPDASACWVESLEDGWLFLIPGWLIAVGGAPQELLEQSHLVADQIAGIAPAAAEFTAHPRIADPLGAPGWLACGSAAMAFDPICGDGTGNAVREAILAAAVIRAAARGENIESLLEHYRSRLIAGFRRHLELSLEFYRAGNSGPWWDREIAALETGVEWCARKLGAEPAYRYRLKGFDLEPLSVR